LNPHADSYKVKRSALVVGGGLSGMAAALSLAEQGIPVHLVEKEKELGGTARRIHYTLERSDFRTMCKALSNKFTRTSHPGSH